MVMTDNTTVVGQLKNQGGTLSHDLYLLTKKLLLWADSHKIVLSAQHIPGHLNVLADLLSRRHQVINTEWSLSPQVATRIWKVWGQPHVDLFATPANAKLPLFVCPYQDPAALDTDAFSLSWTGMWVYAFPPFPLLNEVLQKMSREPCDMILIAPAWPSQSWFHRLLELSVDHPRSLPSHPRLLKQPDQNSFHENVGKLLLHAWRLCSRPCGKKGSLRRWLAASPTLTEPGPRRSMTAAGMVSARGASLGDRILSLPLPL
jgi:hypothetical protein